MRAFLATCLAALAVASGAAGAPCRPVVNMGVLPEWARDGFSDPKPRMPHVLGSSNRIVAIVFGYPLLSPPGEQRSNKILWVSRRPIQPLSDLRISAQRMQGSQAIGPVVRRTVIGGPGPSIIDLPAPGCWRLALHWSGRAGTLDLRFRAR
jgi:hypothetical protein